MTEARYVLDAECDARTTKILTGIATLDKKLDRLHRRLYEDNGEPSLQTRINQNSATARAAHRLIWILITSALTFVGAFLLWHVTH